MDDTDLVREYVNRNSEEAFATLVSRHLNLVYSVAMRQVGNPHQAEEITQAVFIILAKKARGLGKGTILSSWLYQTARLTAANFRRTEIRRVRRQQEAHMESLSSESESDAWAQIAPSLDRAMAQLSEKDRTVIVLRFLEARSFADIGITLQVSESAAERRVQRAVEKLRKLFLKRDVSLSAALVAATVSAHAVQAAPAGLMASVTAAVAAKGALLSGSTLALVNGTLKLMAWMKAKSAIALGALALLAGGIAVVAVRNAGLPRAKHAYTVQGNVEFKAIRASDDGSFHYDLQKIPFEIQAKDGQWLVKLGTHDPMVRVLATNAIRGVTLKSFKPKLPGKTVISEERFNNGSGLAFAYFSEKDWPSEPVARNFEAFKKAKASWAGDGGISLPTGTNAPDISLHRLGGKEEKRLSEYRGKVAVLEFWGTWCPPCQTAMEELQTYARKYPKWRNKVALITLNLDDDPGNAASHLQRKGWNKTDNFWVSRDSVGAYRFNGIPMIYIVNQRGEIAAAGHELDIPENVNRLLRERAE